MKLHVDPYYKDDKNGLVMCYQLSKKDVIKITMTSNEQLIDIDPIKREVKFYDKFLNIISQYNEKSP